LKTKKINNNEENFIIAASKVWNNNIIEELSLATNKNFKGIFNKNDLTKSILDAINPKYIFFTHWSYIIPEEIFLNYDCVVFHMTDLPFGRGGSPLQNLILGGYSKTKVSALKVIKEIDAGPIYSKKDLDLSGNAQEIYERASKVCEKIIIEMTTKTLEPIPQSGDPTYFERRRPSQSNLKGASNLDEIYNMIRMLDADGYPKAFLELKDFKVEFSNCEIKDGIIKTSATFKKI
tara:strand:- start:8762 stop:9463 length:702 start_codon:yes stop_codon:yes gene_type:complete